MWPVVLLVFSLAHPNAAPMPVGGFQKLQQCDDMVKELKADPEFPKDLQPICYVAPVRA